MELLWRGQRGRAENRAPPLHIRALRERQRGARRRVERRFDADEVERQVHRMVDWLPRKSARGRARLRKIDGGGR
jgi:hypothetical protein